MTTTAPASVTTAATTDGGYRLSFGRVLRSETIKLLTVRSTWWSLAIAIVLSVGMSVLIAAASRDFAGGYPAALVIVSPMQFTMLVAGILGAIVVTGEYSTGMIRSTLAAEPRRGTVIAAKAIAVALLIAVTTVLTYALAIVATAGLLGSHGLDWSSLEQSWAPLGAGILSMVVFALIGLGWGFIIRNGAGAIAATVGVLFVLPIATSMFSLGGEAWEWVADLARYLPMSAAQNLTTPGAEGHTGALVALLAWAAVSLAGGWAVLRTRDA